MSRKRKNAAVFADLCNSVQKRMFAFEYSVDDETGTAELVLDSVHRVKLGHLSLFPSVKVTYRQDDRRYVVETHASAFAMRHNAMLVEYDRMSKFYEISDMTQLKHVIETVHKNASVCFHKIVKQGDNFIAMFSVPTALHEMRLNTGILNDIDNISSSWIELHPDTRDLRLCVSLISQSVPRRKRTRDDTGSDCEDHLPSRRRARMDALEKQGQEEVSFPSHSALPPLLASPAAPSAASSSLSASQQSSKSRPNW